MARVQFDRHICQDSSETFKREWLETNGMGGFASSTISGANTRRYHGLLVAATIPPAVRHLLLSKLEETLIVAGQQYELSSNFYPGAVHPEGYRYLTGFRLDPFPVFTFEAGGVRIEKRVFMVQGESTVVVEYETAQAASLEVRPLLAFRGYHDLTQANQAFNSAVESGEGLLSTQPYAMLPRLWFAQNAKSLGKEGYWYFNFEYPVERERGLDFHEDLFCPFSMKFELAPQSAAVVIASTVAHQVSDSAVLKAAEIARRDLIDNPMDEPLLAAGDQFIVSRGKFRSIIAGYPWFADWGRDTMIALPGLTLVTGRLQTAKDLLLAFAAHLDQGMLPNRFSDTANGQADGPQYNTVDATLWFFEAIRKYLTYSGDRQFVRARLYESLKDVVSWHMRGTRFGIHMDTDGLLAAGDPSTSLTWMDARVGDRPITPRNGKAVEIQALWYNALRVLDKLARDFGDEEAGIVYRDAAVRTCKHFNAAFWNEHAGYYADVVDAGVQDLSMRPNQVIALSLGFCAVPVGRARRVLDAVRRDLLTPFGLRTLSRSDSSYIGKYEGSPAERDSAYHQGTVWPWLLGPFIAADMRFNGEAARERAHGILDGMRAFMLSRGTGQVPEIFDGDAPHQPRGCFAQAWSVGELLRAGARANGRAG